MPFTASHPAAVLPFFGRAGLVPAALVIGSMAPDLPYFLQLGSDSSVTHSVAGVVTVDLFMGLLAFVTWQGLVVPAAVALAPAGVRARTGAPAPLRRFVAGRRVTALLVASLALGSLTHVVWDTFTHANRWGTEHVGWLNTQHGLLPGYHWAQYGSGVLGLLILAWAVGAWWRRTPPAAELATPGGSPRLALACWVALTVSASVAGLAGLAVALAHDEGLRRAMFRAATWGGGAGLLVVLGVSVLYARQRRRRPAPA